MAFKPGDRVVVNARCTQAEWHGLEGTIVSVDHLIRAKMDKPVRGTIDPGHLTLGFTKWDLAEVPSYIPEDWS